MNMAEERDDHPLIDNWDVEALRDLQLPVEIKHWCAVNGITEEALLRAGWLCLDGREKNDAALAAFQLGFLLCQKQEQKRADLRA